MSITVWLALLLISFLTGLCLGLTKKTRGKQTKVENHPRDLQLERLCSEYRNFLNYDGTEQS